MSKYLSERCCFDHLCQSDFAIVNVAILPQRMDLTIFLYSCHTFNAVSKSLLGSVLRLARIPVVLRGSIDKIFYEKKLSD